jgi:sugar (pentulose or hexulose) kinase
MSVVGIDLGAQSTKIGVARNKGIDIVRIHCPATPASPHSDVAHIFPVALLKNFSPKKSIETD